MFKYSLCNLVESLSFPFALEIRIRKNQKCSAGHIKNFSGLHATRRPYVETIALDQGFSNCGERTTGVQKKIINIIRYFLRFNITLKFTE